MTKKRDATTWIAAVLMLSLATSAWADSDSDSDSDSDLSIVGSWEAVSTLEPSGEEAPGLFTFNGDRTWIASAGDLAFSNAHGTWKQTGSRTFTATNRGFVFGPDGTASLGIRNRVNLTLSSDGDSFTTEFETEISLLNGTVVDSFTGTATGSRIEIESL